MSIRTWRHGLGDKDMETWTWRHKLGNMELKYQTEKEARQFSLIGLPFVHHASGSLSLVLCWQRNKRKLSVRSQTIWTNGLDRLNGLVRLWKLPLQQDRPKNKCMIAFVPDRRMWAQQAHWTRQYEIRKMRASVWRARENSPVYSPASPHSTAASLLIICTFKMQLCSYLCGKYILFCSVLPHCYPCPTALPSQQSVYYNEKTTSA